MTATRARETRNVANGALLEQDWQEVDFYHEENLYYPRFTGPHSKTKYTAEAIYAASAAYYNI